MNNNEIRGCTSNANLVCFKEGCSYYPQISPNKYGEFLVNEILEKDNEKYIVIKGIQNSLRVKTTNSKVEFIEIPTDMDVILILASDIFIEE